MPRGDNFKTHGLSKSHKALYVIWNAMRQRCNDRNAISYPNYGGRGIKVCARWDDFANFVADMGERPSGLSSIDREDNDAGYSPSNCKWSTRAEQAKNRRTTVWVQVGDDMLCLKDACTKLHLSYNAIHRRVSVYGYPPEEAISFPVAHREHKRYLIDVDGQSMSLKAACKAKNISFDAVRARLKLGWDMDKALNTPVVPGRNQYSAA